MPSSKSLDEWRRAVRELARDEFVVQHPYPFLVPEKVPQRGKSKTDPRFLTARFDNAALEEKFRAIAAMDPFRVIAVVPKGKEVFEGVIGIGRAKSNDILIESDQVSKFHAFFTRDLFEPDYYLTDSASTNGTFRNEKQLDPKRRMRLEDGDLLGFASDFAFRFHTSEGFYDAMRREP